ncbi:ABC transporter ATP-binding protein [Streptomyces sp. H27-C3]|uniref:ABC transporter ATP-binding protein n=1 Tax=Streptomyces sp. H27-C3 TaxID=3046305 RepID=UPI0024BBC75A|nr:ABC transporter ATP-binding protein [Streptomyces sp. H27-C3]MDJ0461234.1 ABC transporter ATP-binding protein [Streptomyces sp. H27-C3]
MSAASRALSAGRLVATAAPGRLILYAVPSLAAGAFPVAIAWSTKLIVDSLAAGATAGELLIPALTLVATGVATGATPTLTHYLRTELDRRVGLLAQDRLFMAVDRFAGLGRFESPDFLDRLRLAQQTVVAAPAANQAVDGVLGAARSVFTVVGFLGSLFIISPPTMVLVLLAALPILVAELLLSSRRAATDWNIGPAERRQFFYMGLLANVEAAKEIRLFGTGGFLRERMLANRRSADQARRAVDRREVQLRSGLGLLAAAVAGAGLLWTVGAARGGGLTPGDVTVFLASVAGVQTALTTLAGDVASTHHALLLFGHYQAVVSAGPELPMAAAPHPLPQLRRGIELRDVWFRYSPRHPWVLRGVDLWIPHGSSVALVGRNGSGKSTLVKLLCRFYDPTRGAILWDGVDIRDADIAALRRRISAVFQDYMEYDLTAVESIAQGDLGAIDEPERIREAARRAGVHDVLTALPDGYDTLLSRMFFTESDKADPATGVMLSGGQSQRLALARAFVRDKRDLMILDEPSAGLDAAAEHEIHKSLRTHREGRTSLLISHRLGAVRDADVIVGLSGGRIVESGSHSTLVASGGEYARLYALQAAGYRPGPPQHSAPYEPADPRTSPLKEAP